MVTALYYTLAPPVGTVTLGIRPSSSTDLYAGSAYYTGVDQTTPFCGTFTSSGTSRFPAITTTCTAGDFVVATLGEIAAPVTADGAGQTRLWNIGASHYNTYTHKTATTPATMSHTINASKDWGMVAAYMGTTALLPIELLNFSSYQQNEYVEINWSTATEEGNDYFTVEKSTDAINFTTLEIIKSKAQNGNSLNKLDYHITDTNSHNGIVYYRLKQTDYNKNEKHFQIVSVDKNSIHKNFDFTIYPNPNNGDFNIRYNGLKNNAPLEVVITNGLGEIIYSSFIKPSEDFNVLQVTPDKKFPQGIYFCNITIDNAKYVCKMMVE